MAGELTEDGFLRPNHVTAVPTGIDTDRFRPGDGQGPRQRIGLPESAFIFGIVATLRSWKGHDALLEAFANIAPKDALLLIVGDGTRENFLMEQANSLGIQDRVRMAGRQDDVLPFLRAMDAFVLPSYKNEGVPQALLQAMACELSVIASQVGGIPELVDGLDAVRQVSPMDVQALGDAMTHAMAHRPDAASCKALRKRVTDHYTIDGMYDRVLSVFEKSIKKRKSITSRTG
jgi:glycosyltransferase involved in cell wall biosynthesis